METTEPGRVEEVVRSLAKRLVNARVPISFKEAYYAAGKPLQEAIHRLCGNMNNEVVAAAARQSLGVTAATITAVFVFLLLCFALAKCAPSAFWCSTVVSSGLACYICAPPCYTAVFNLCSSVSLLHSSSSRKVSGLTPTAHASGVLLNFPVSVVSVLKCTFGFAFCPVAVYTMILCSCRPL
jgi:hypothetical protein